MTARLALCVLLVYVFVFVIATTTRESAVTLYDRARHKSEREVGYGQVRFEGAGPERWALRFRRERRVVESLRRELSARLDRLVYLVQAFECVHRFEGAWGSNTGNGYFGGLQFGASEWQRFGGRYAASAEQASPAEQITAAIGYHALAGFYPWPNTARACGLIR